MSQTAIPREKRRYDPQSKPCAYIANRKLPVSDDEFLTAVRTMGRKNTADHYGVSTSRVNTRLRELAKRGRYV